MKIYLNALIYIALVLLCIEDFPPVATLYDFFVLTFGCFILARISTLAANFKF